MTLATYKPTATFTPKPFHSGAFNKVIPASAKLGPVPDTDEECREWLLAAIELEIRSLTYCDDSQETGECDCESCFYMRSYENDTAEGHAKTLVGQIETLNPGRSLRELLTEIAQIRHNYWSAAWGSGHTYNDAYLVVVPITEYAPLESSEIPGCSINMPQFYDG